MENIPITFVPDSTAALADIEKKAGLAAKSIIKARYIKLIVRHIPNQRTAHIILTFRTREGANQAIKFSLSIASKKVYGRKLLPELSRCLKYHSFEGNHMAINCLKDHNTYGTCGEQHCTVTCKVNDPNIFHCTNCDVKGHTSWSRDCPTFIGK
ncbi:hypothetical protein BDR05DRAFT_890813 [Suillus weaverae]|nr:hypothetical protein BDR05DRAFT_890813 [Suillus weaverae]